MNDLKSNYSITKLIKYATHPNHDFYSFIFIFFKQELHWTCILVIKASSLYFTTIYAGNCACGALELTHETFVKNTANTLK